MTDIIETSFINFDKENESSLKNVFAKLSNSQKVLEKLIEVYKEKVLIEEEYSKKMSMLSAKALEDSENGANTEQLLKIFKLELGSIGKSHEEESQSIREKILEPLVEFRDTFDTQRSDIEKKMLNDFKNKNQLFNEIEKNKLSYSNDCIKLYKFYSHNIHNPEAQSQLRKLEQSLSVSRKDYENSVKKYKKASSVWTNQWEMASSELKLLENDRINYLKSNIWNFTNCVSSTCVNVDHSCEQIRLELESCDTVADLRVFEKGLEIGCKEPEVIDFMESVNEESILEENSFTSLKSSLHLKTNKQVTFTNSINERQRAQDNDFKQKFAQMHDDIQQMEIKSPFGTIQTVSKAKSHQANNSSFMNDTSVFDNNKYHHDSQSENINVLQQQRQPQQQVQQHEVESSTSGSSGYDSLGRQGTNASTYSGSSSTSKTWSSPTRRRSKMGLSAQSSPTKSSSSSSPVSNSAQNFTPYTSYEDAHMKKLKEAKQAQLNRYYEMNKPNVVALHTQDDSTLNSSTMHNFNPEEVGVDDPLRAALEDLRIGGNGDFNALKERNNSIKSSKSNKSKMRPKSMIEIAELSHKSSHAPPNPQNSGKLHPMHSVQQTTQQSVQSSRKIPLAPNGLPLVASNGRNVLRHAKALYEYKASIPEEVSFKRKDLMLVIGMQDDGWWEVEVLGSERRFGLAPSNYLVPA